MNFGGLEFPIILFAFSRVFCFLFNVAAQSPRLFIHCNRLSSQHITQKGSESSLLLSSIQNLSYNHETKCNVPCHIVNTIITVFPAVIISWLHNYMESPVCINTHCILCPQPCAAPALLSWRVHGFHYTIWIDSRLELKIKCFSCTTSNGNSQKSVMSQHVWNEKHGVWDRK